MTNRDLTYWKTRILAAINLWRKGYTETDKPEPESSKKEANLKIVMRPCGDCWLEIDVPSGLKASINLGQYGRANNNTIVERVVKEVAESKTTQNVVKCKATAIISPSGEVKGLSPGGIGLCMRAWTQAVQSTGKFIPQLQKLGYKIAEGYFIEDKRNS